MRYMLIERFSDGPGPVYRRASEKGRLLPDGLRYIDSWIVDDGRLDTCFQLMETDDVSLFDDWIVNWADLSSFEVFPVIDSSEAANRVGTAWSDGIDAGGSVSNGGIESSKVAGTASPATLPAASHGQ